MLHAHLRKRGTGIVVVLTVPYARWTQIELADLGMLKASMHANVLARARHGRLDEILLLLTSLEVRAYPAPHTVRHRCPPPPPPRPPPLPATPGEALARAQLLLALPPTPDKINDWRATIQSLIGFANGDTPRQPRQVSQARPDGDKTGGGATTVHSPPRRPRSPTRR